MIPVFSLEWLAYEVGKFIGFRLTERAAKRLFLSLRSVPKAPEDLVVFDRNIRYEAISEISGSKENVLSAMNSAASLNHSELFDSLGILRKKLEKLTVYLESAGDLTVEKGKSARGFVNLDFILVSGCFALNELARDLRDRVYKRDFDGAKAILGEMEENARKLERLLHIRSTALHIPDKQFLKFLEAENNDVYEALRSLAVLAYSGEEKKGFFRRGENYENIMGRTLYVAKLLEEKSGPVIELKDFYLEFRKANPDMEIKPKDLEKALARLAEEGWIAGMDHTDEKMKVVVTKLDYKRILELASETENLMNGLTIDNLKQKTNWPITCIQRVLNALEEKGVARKAFDMDGTPRWFFPGLKQTPETR